MIPFSYSLMTMNQNVNGLFGSFPSSIYDHCVLVMCLYSTSCMLLKNTFQFLILLTADANSFAVQHSSFFNCCHHLHVSSASSELLWPRNDSQDDTFRVIRYFLHWERQKKFEVVWDAKTPYLMYATCCVLNRNTWFCLSSIRLCVHCIALYIICCSACVLLYFVSCERCSYIMSFIYHWELC